MRKIVDMTLLLSEDMPCSWPAHMPFKRTNWNWYERVETDAGCVLRDKNGAYHTGWLIIDEHTGTHFDAPLTMFPLPAIAWTMPARLAELPEIKWIFQKCWVTQWW